MRTVTRPDWQQALVLLTGTIIAALIVIVLYWARAVCIPLALAIFFTFVLSPLVHALQRRGLSRVPAVIVVVLGAVMVLTLVMGLVTQQTLSLVRTLPDHTDAIKEKIHTIQGWTSSEDNGRLNKLVEDLTATAEGRSTAPPPPGVPTVYVEPRNPGWLAKAEAYIPPVIELVAQAVFAFVLIVFMLIKKEDLRNRLLSLIGAARVTTATRAIDDASSRVSKYLLTQAIVNVSFAVVVTVLLFALGVPYAILWGVVAGLMRYVPYVGSVLGGALPVLFSFALGDALWQPIAVLAMFLLLDLLTGHVIEPWLYGHSMGLSPVAQLVAASFWVFLWGPIGLVLSGPLTVCLLVLGRHVGALEFLTVLLGDQPTLDPDIMLYQRLTARDEDEAESIVLQEAENSTYEDVCDRVLVPALSRTKQAQMLGDLTEEEADKVLASATRLLNVLEDATTEPKEESADDAERIPLVFCPARDEVDRQALDMLARRLDSNHWQVELTTEATLTSELLQKVREVEPAVVCIGSVAPGGVAHVRYLCKRLQAQFPELRLIVYRPGLGEPDEETAKQLMAAGVAQVTSSLDATHQYLQSWQPVLTTAAGD